jgi:hypothetical protein
MTGLPIKTFRVNTFGINSHKFRIAYNPKSQNTTPATANGNNDFIEANGGSFHSLLKDRTVVATTV